MIDKKLITVILLITFVGSFVIIPSTGKAAGFDWWYFIDNFIIRPILKKIVDSLENKALNAMNDIITDKLNGGRLPHFITDWRDKLLKSIGRGNDVFRTILADTQLCPYFNNNLKKIFGADRLVGVATPPFTAVPPGTETFQFAQRCLLDPSININNFANDFTQGGWEAWVQLLQPNNNFFGAFTAALNEQSEQRLVGQKAESSEDIANNGALPRRIQGILSGQPGSLTSLGSSEGCVGNWGGGSGGIRCIFFGKNQTPGTIFKDAAQRQAIDQKLQTLGMGSTDMEIVLQFIANLVVNKVSGALLNYLNVPAYNVPATSGYINQAGQTPAPGQACRDAAIAQRDSCVSNCDINPFTFECPSPPLTANERTTCVSNERSQCRVDCANEFNTNYNACP